MSKKNPAGRPAGTKQRIAIDLPDEGERLVPYYSDFAKAVGLTPKTLQRMRRRMPVVVLSGVAYVKDKAGRRVLAEPKKARGARR
jgi:hypothetical protein